MLSGTYDDLMDHGQIKVQVILTWNSIEIILLFAFNLSF